MAQIPGQCWLLKVRGDMAKGLFCGKPAQFCLLLGQLESGSDALCPSDARDTVCLLSCLELVPVILGWAEGTVKS